MKFIIFNCLESFVSSEFHVENSAAVDVLIQSNQFRKKNIYLLSAVQTVFNRHTQKFSSWIFGSDFISMEWMTIILIVEIIEFEKHCPTRDFLFGVPA